MISASDEHLIKILSFINGTIYYSNYSDPIIALGIQNYYSINNSYALGNEEKYLLYASSSYNGLMLLCFSILLFDLI